MSDGRQAGSSASRCWPGCMTARGEMTAAEGALERGVCGSGSRERCAVQWAVASVGHRIALTGRAISRQRGQATWTRHSPSSPRGRTCRSSRERSRWRRWCEADIAERSRAGRDEAGAAAAEARLGRPSRTARRRDGGDDASYRRGPALEARGHVALTDAESTRAMGASDRRGWRLAVDLLVERRDGRTRPRMRGIGWRRRCCRIETLRAEASEELRARARCRRPGSAPGRYGSGSKRWRPGRACRLAGARADETVETGRLESTRSPPTT